MGAGYAGVEALAELNDMAKAALRSYPSLRERPQRWVLADAAAKILPEIPRRLGEYAARQLERRGIEIQVDTTLESYDGREAVLANGVRIPARTLVWTTGVRASPLLPELDVPLDERGRVIVDEMLRVGPKTCGRSATALRCRTPRHRAWSIHRRASTLSARHGSSRRTSPARRSRTATRCSARSRRSGTSRASPRSDLHLWGFPGWCVTRSYHLYQLPLFTRKLRVVADWTVALFFSRDIVELSMLGHPRKLGDDS